jgi:histidine triad (HIT) family protein
MDCVFCNIAAGKIPSEIVYRDEDIVAFPDIHPKAPVHIIIIPKKHVESLNQVEDMGLVAKMIIAAQKIAKDKGIYDRGYQLVINTGKEGGQVVQHLHMHLVGGKMLKG